MKMRPVKSLNELRFLAAENESYKKLLLISAENLGGNPKGDTQKAFDWLMTNAIETDEEGVVDEVNFCRDLVK